MKNIDEKSIIFRCPAHYCFSCYGKDYQLSKSRPVTCALCSMTLHLKCMAENQYTKIRKSTYVCTIHLSKDLGFDLVEELRLFTDRKATKKNTNDKKIFIDRIKKLKELKALEKVDNEKQTSPPHPVSAPVPAVLPIISDNE